MNRLLAIVWGNGGIYMLLVLGPVHPHLGEAYYPHPHDDAKVLCYINHASTTPPVRTRLAHFHSLVMGIIVSLLHKKMKFCFSQNTFFIILTKE